ncbi:ABC-2 family transporter protein [Deefgea piscis]|uniref:ABC-2 family transporter protein n=1 Tax=Deefgea piscis TaxID=2739061 RepID=A0A6M8SRC8_9NEIS|nr:ABC-2 family transporter protein [Deefgea piscis]QKJ65856.1 ABC-2 family transporter protein [Deefgea piscis]
MLGIPFKACTALAWGSARLVATDRKGRWLVTIGYLIAMWLLYYLWAALYAESPTRAGMTFNSAVLHVLVAQTLLAFLPVGTDWRLAREIRSGEVATQLIQPMSLPLRQFAISLGRALAKATYILPAFALFLWYFDLSLTPKTIPLALASIALSFVLLFCIDFVVALAGFIATDLWGITASKDAVVMFLGGALMPMAFFPAEFREVLAYLPFGHFFNTPVGYINGDIVSVQPLLIQAAWALGFVFAAALAGRVVLRKLIVFGA